MNKKQVKLDEALTLLQSRVAEGMEFPDACWHAADKFGVTVDDLRVAYDAQCLAAEAPKDPDAQFYKVATEVRAKGAKNWTPEEAAQQAQLDSSDYQISGDKTEMDFIFNDMKLNCDTNQDYKKTLVQIAPDLAKAVEDALIHREKVEPTDPIHSMAQAAGYEVFRYTGTNGDLSGFTWRDAQGVEFSAGSEAWTTATNRYLAGLAPVDSENKIDMLKALEQKRILQLPNPHGDEPTFLVLKGAEVHPVSKLIVATGWMVDGLGAKLETSYPNPVSLSSGGWKVPSESMARDIVDDNSPPRLGKGALNCRVMGESGEVLREVSMKARFDTMNLVVMTCSPPTVVAPVPESEWLDFDPLKQPDPVTGQKYTAFEYIDDIGEFFAVNPATLRPDFHDDRALNLLMNNSDFLFQGSEIPSDYERVDLSQHLTELAESVGLQETGKDWSAALVKTVPGEIWNVFVTESSKPYYINAEYFPVVIHAKTADQLLQRERELRAQRPENDAVRVEM